MEYKDVASTNGKIVSKGNKLVRRKKMSSFNQSDIIHTIEYLFMTDSPKLINISECHS